MLACESELRRMTAIALAQAYIAAFNRGDTSAMLDLVSEDIAHHVNEGGVRIGKQAFADFNTHMTRCYKERLEDIVVFGADDPTRAAAEFTVFGEYLATDAGLPEANGQTYTLPAGTFFTVTEGKISRITTYYNLSNWIAQVSA
ncbi:MAG: hypothetical protein RLZZ505_2123 [Verrucomicrobiota bacterium]|jgi:steroid delta-isomerase-like uncharacterized protein